MHKSHLKIKQKHIVGLTICTNNTNEMSPKNAKIGGLVNRYFLENISDKIKNKINADETYCGYTDYESDEYGGYLYYIGQEVSSFDNQPAELSQITIPEQEYAKFTVGPGKLPEVIMASWQKIWQMKPEDFGGTRAYLNDFELHGVRASDQQNATIDIFIGIK